MGFAWRILYEEEERISGMCVRARDSIKDKTAGQTYKDPDPDPAAIHGGVVQVINGRITVSGSSEISDPAQAWEAITNQRSTFEAYDAACLK